VFRALVYNKGAAVLHMLRRLIGDEAFFRGLKNFYAENRFKKAGTDDLRQAMERASGRDLNRFFDRWIYDNGIPRLRYSTAVEGSELIVRFEQSGDIYDVPVTVAVTYTDGKTAEFIVVSNDATNVQSLPLAGTVRSVEANPDGAAVAIIEKNRLCVSAPRRRRPLRLKYNSLLMDLVTLTIDGRQLSVPKGTSVLKAAIEAGIQVPYYCYHPGLGIDASCRVCLVKIEKMAKLQTSCSTPVAEGMIVHTQDPEAVEAARACSNSS
jgi:ferredoxin